MSELTTTVVIVSELGALIFYCKLIANAVLRLFDANM